MYTNNFGKSKKRSCSSVLNPVCVQKLDMLRQNEELTV